MQYQALFFFILLISCPLMAKEDSARSILMSLLGQTKGNFKIDGCEKTAINPTEIFKAIKYKTSFSEKCDIQGEVAIKIFQSFPIELQLKDLASYKKLTATAKLLIGMENPPTVLAELTQAKLHGKETIYFNAYYSGELQPATTLKVKPGTENIKIQIVDKYFKKKKEEFSIKIK